MLEGIRENEIIVGAYSDGRGVCPMLAAHRAGGRTSLISFAHAWDRFGFRGGRAGSARRATERELLVLRTHLEASLLEDDGPNSELARAMAEHRELTAKRSEERQASRADVERPRLQGDLDRSTELRRRDGWAWLRVFRRYDEYERALDRLDVERPCAEERKAGALG